MLNKVFRLMFVLVLLLGIPTTVTHAASGLSLTVVSPNGGELLTVGDVYRITWDSTPDIDMVTIGYKSCPSCLDWIAYNIPNTGYYDWTVYVGNTTNTEFTIEIIGYDVGVGSVIDYSDAPFTVQQPHLSAPILLTPINGQVVTTTRPYFDWEDVPGATSYTLQVSTSSDFSKLLLNTNISGASEITSKMPRKTILYWRVRAFGQINPSDWSTGFFKVK